MSTVVTCLPEVRNANLAQNEKVLGLSGERGMPVGI